MVDKIPCPTLLEYLVPLFGSFNYRKRIRSKIEKVYDEWHIFQKTEYSNNWKRLAVAHGLEVALLTTAISSIFN